MTKKVIAIISVLKPVDDTRNYEKVARSISNTNKYDINIIGFRPKNIPSCPNVTFHPVFEFGRSSFKRAGASLIVLRKILKLKPEVIIVNTPEILIVIMLYKILFGARIIYDIQENYYRNVLYTRAYPVLVRWPLAILVRVIELMSSPFTDRFILAEKVYLKQMNYVKEKAVVIENKALIPRHISERKRSISKDLLFVYSGAIAEHYGIFDAITFMERLKTFVTNIRLVIIGYAAQKSIRQKLLSRIEYIDYIKISGADELVPHDQILMQMKQADFCLLPYQRNRSTEGRIPTKLFECLAMEIPVIITPNPAWNDIIQKNDAGIIHNFKSPNTPPWDQLHGNYYGNSLSGNYLWDNEADKLLEAISNV